VATVAECEQAFATLAERLSGADATTRRKASFDRTLSCRLTDLDVIFGGRLTDGRLTDIGQRKSPDAQIRLAMSSDDLLRLVDGTLPMAGAWAGGRVKIDASVFDLLKLRSIF
jgi:hypothetical protein